MKKAELEQRLSAAENTLKAIIEICDRSHEDILKEYNEDSLKRIGKAIYDQSNVCALKVGMVEAEAKWYFSRKFLK